MVFVTGVVTMHRSVGKQKENVFFLINNKHSGGNTYKSPFTMEGRGIKKTKKTRDKPCYIDPEK